MTKEKDESAEGKPTDSSNSRPTIAFLTHSLSDSYGMLLWEGAMEAAREENCNLICFPGWAINDKRSFNAQANIIYQLVSKRTVDGVVVSSGTLGDYIGIENLQKFCEYYRSLPIASIAVELQGIPSITIENRLSMCTMVTHLIEQHKLTRIVFVSGNEKSEEAKARYLGFQDALNKYGLTPAFVTPHAHWEDSSGVHAIKLLFDEKKLIPGRDFQAVVAGSDNVAIGILRELRARGIRVPEDMALTGFDGQENTKYLTPRLTTVRQPLREQSFLATKCVIDQIRGKAVEKKKLLPTEIQIRQSCGCPHIEVKRAKADNTVKLPNLPRMPRSLDVANVKVKMAQALADPPTNPGKEQVERLLNAFFTEMGSEPSGDFLTVLRDILRQSALADQDVVPWQEAISVMRRELSSFIEEDHHLYRAEDLWQQSRVIIGERAQRIEGYRRFVEEQRQATLDRINQELVSTSSPSELMDILARELSNLEIPGCYVSMYENPVVLPTNGCQLILAYQDGHVNPAVTDTHFYSWQLVPPGLLPPNKPYNLIVEPLYFRENQIGLAVFQAGPRHGAVYETLRGQLSSALWSSRLVQYLRSLYEASNTIMSLQEPKEILQHMEERVCRAVGAKGANVIGLDKEGRPERLSSEGGFGTIIQSSILLGTAGMVAQVMRNNEPILIEDIRKQAGPSIQSLIELGVGAAGCFPLRLRDKPVGAMWVYYEKTHHFPRAEVNALQLYVNQAAIAYDNARRMKELDHLRRAAEKLAQVSEVKEVLQRIVESAREVLGADSAIIWSYDAAREIFLPTGLVASGVSSNVLEKFREDEPRPGGTASIVMEKKYLAISNVEDPQFSFLNIPARGLRSEIGVKSFQGISLQVENQSLGVLYANYKSPRVFDEEDKSVLKAFADYAALALQKARLLEQVNRVHNTARVIAEISIQKELRYTLETVVRGTRDALSCDSVLLFVYNQRLSRLEHPPIMVGVRYRERAANAGKVLSGSLVYEMMMQNKPYIVDVIAQDPLFASRRFAKDEEIESCMAIPLLASNQRVGVMFVNYRTRYHFTGEELDDIEIFTHQAAVAIHAAHLLDETKKRTAYLETLYEAGRMVTSTLALDEILNRIAEQASLLTAKTGGQQAHYCYLALKEADKLVFKATYPSYTSSKSVERTYAIDLERDRRISIVGRAFKSGESQLVSNIMDGPEDIEHDQGTHSILAVPIKLGEHVIGVIDVEHPNYEAFDKDDQQALEALARQAAIAIKNAQLFEETQRQAIQLVAASKVARDTTAILDVEQLFDQTVKLISEQFSFYHAGIFLIDEQKQYAILKAASSKGGQNMLEHEHKLKIGEVGIVGMVAQSGQSRIVLDVDKDDFYFDNPYLPATRSEIALPLQVHGQLIGVLDVQSEDANAFNEADKVVLQTMADQLAIAIENARQYEELKRTQGLVGARTALAWMGMASSAWRHTIDKHAISIKEQVDLLSNDLHGLLLSDKHPRLEERLSMIRRLAQQIGEKQITPPLSAEEGVVSLSVNGLIRERIKQLSENEPYRSVEFRLNLTLANEITVRASSEWLRRALDILIDNAVEAMADVPHRMMTIETVQGHNKIMIRISDTGKGIPEEVHPHLFRDPVEKRKGSKGLGMGLLMAQAIIQTYGGEIAIGSTGITGTTMFIFLPSEA